jgi:hypothetical protein
MASLDSEFRPMQINVRGNYDDMYGRSVRVNTPRELASAGVKMAPEPVMATWGEEGLQEYQNALKEMGTMPIASVKSQPLQAEVEVSL